MGEDLSRYSNKIKSTDQQSVFKRYHSKKHIYESFTHKIKEAVKWLCYPQDCGENQLA